MKFRKAAETDLERLVDIHHSAYPDARPASVRQRNFTHNAFGSLDQLIVAEEEGQLVAHAFLFPFRAFFGGVQVRMGGIASVGVAPEVRGRGVATALMDHLHVVSDRRGDAVTMLYAFRHGFYSRLGYTTTSSRKRLAIDTRAVPESWRALARERVRAPRGSDRGPIHAAHARAAARASGWIARSKGFWERLLTRERRILLVCESPREGSKRGSKRDRLSGYVAFAVVQEQPHAETLIEVEELVADNHETRRALLGALSSMRDQVAEIILEIADSDPLERGLLDPDGRRYGTEAVEHSLGEVVGGPMVRVEDIPRAIEARGYEGSGSFDVVVRSAREDDGDLIAVGVRVREGRAEVGPARGGGALRTTRAGLAAIFYGGLSATDAVGLGLAEAEARIASRVDAVTRMAPLTPLDAF